MRDTYYFIPLFQVTLPFSPLSLFSLCFPCGSFPFHLSFIPISRLSPPLIQLGVWGSAVSSPSGSGRSPAAKCNLVNSGPRNERFLTCQCGKLQCSLNSLICFWFSDSINCFGQFTNLSKWNTHSNMVLVNSEAVSTSEKINGKNKKLNNTKQQYIEHNEAVHTQWNVPFWTVWVPWKQ